MILSKDKNIGKPKQPVMEDGERTKATKRFNNKADVPDALRPKLMNAVVHLDYNNNAGIGSGVILSAEADTDVAYVLTAKHLLYKWADQKKALKKPADIVTTEFLNKVKIYYGPTALEAVAPTFTPAGAVVGVDYTASSDQTWNDDFMVLKINNKLFHDFVVANRFVPALGDTTYQLLLKRQNNDTRNILDDKQFIYVQMGYGSGRDKEVLATAGYDDLRGRLQCRWTAPLAKSPAVTAFEVDHKAGVVTDSLNNACLLSASNVTSTGEGDSGGPLFAIPLRVVDRTTFYLVGVTAGANYFTDPRFRENPRSAPGDDGLHNNAIAFWDKLFAAWDWS
jgi:hypothetical protein